MERIRWGYLSFSCNDMLDTQPPCITNTGFTSIANAPLYSGYDDLGRTFFLNTNFKF